MHAIATNVCFDMLRSAKRRALVLDLSQVKGPWEDLGAPLPPDVWLDPMPDSRLIATQDPGEVVQERESVRLAFIAALQCLPPRQRAVLVLRDVLAFTAEETAEILGATVPSVNSARQRARASLTARRPDPSSIADPKDAGQRELLRRYVIAFEAHDVEGLKAILREDAVASMPPFAWRGRRRGDRRGSGRERRLRGSATGTLPHERRLGVRAVPSGRRRRAPSVRPGGGRDLRRRISRMVTFLGTQHRFREFGLPGTL